MISVEEAGQRINQSITPVATEIVPLSQALGRVLAETLTARLTQPPAAVSAMDGYAVRAGDVASIPAQLRLIGVSAAGNGFDGAVKAGETVRIFTGAPLPAGSDAIVIQEDTEERDGMVTVKFQPVSGRHVREAGMDFADGDPILMAGTRLTARHVALAAAMNRPWLRVYRRPRIAILATGDEVVLPGDPVGPGQIISSNSFLIAAMVEAAGGIPVNLGIARDDIDTIRTMARQGADADLLVTIGGASVGEFDLVQRALAEIGLDVGFWKIAMKPGKPLMFGHLDNKMVLGLPGNPVSAFACSLLFLLPAIDRLQGLPGAGPMLEAAVTGAPIAANGVRQEYLRADLHADAAGRLTAIPAARQDSSLLTVLADATALIVRAPHAPAAQIGDAVSIIRLPANSRSV